MAKLSTTLTSLLGIAACAAAIGVIAAANGSSAPASAPAPAPPQTPATTTTVTPPPATTTHARVTAQERVAPQRASIPARPVTRDPVNAPAGETFNPPPAPHVGAGYQRPPAWPGYQPPAGTGPSRYYYSCLRQAHAYGNDRASLTCQYLANTVPGN
ncbi:MAG: hypothetical protein ACRDRN_15090 [Sciscionella sp.]